MLSSIFSSEHKKTHVDANATGAHLPVAEAPKVPPSIAQRLFARISQCEGYEDRRKMLSLSLPLLRSSSDDPANQTTLADVLKLLDLFKEGGPKEDVTADAIYDLSSVHAFFPLDLVPPRRAPGADTQAPVADYIAAVLAYFLEPRWFQVQVSSREKQKEKEKEKVAPLSAADALTKLKTLTDVHRVITKRAAVYIYLWLTITEPITRERELELENAFFASCSDITSRLILIKTLPTFRKHDTPHNSGWGSMKSMS